MYSAKNDISDVHALFRTVVDGGYCIGCGACAAFENSPITMDMDKYGRMQAVSNYSINQYAAKVLQVCPFSEESVNENEIASNLFSKYCQMHDKLGYYQTNYVGFVSEGNYRLEGSSGGIGTWIICELLKEGLVDYAVHVHEFSKDQSRKQIFGYRISSTLEEVRKGAKSRYYPVEMSQVIKQIRKKPGSYVIIGVPCYIKAVRLLARQDPVLSERLKFCIGIVCGHMKSTQFSEMLAWQCGINPSELISINFRKKIQGQNANQYGVEVVGKQNGNIVHITKSNYEFYGYLWGQGFFKYEACDYCDDVLAETADVTVGDAWIAKYVNDSKGTNIVIVRNPLVGQIIDKANKAGRLVLDNISANEVAKSQNAGLRHRREGLAYRLHVKDQEHLWRPKKRITAQKYHLNLHLRKIHKIRVQMSKLSHEAFFQAKQKNDFEYFKHKMAPLVNIYDELYKPSLRKTIVRKAKNVVKANLIRLSLVLPNIAFVLSNGALRSKRKIIYLLTPPPYLNNIGDHAQVIAIRQWFEKHYSDLPVIETDKDQTKRLITGLIWLTNNEDIIFLHSGGNLGDRGMWSEEIRRLVIKKFPKNKVISLPQTIFFSDTQEGRTQRDITSRIYSEHKQLTIIGRDPESGELATKLFPTARTFSIPDFVLSLPMLEKSKSDLPNLKVLFCLRQDNESVLSQREREQLVDSIVYDHTLFDTTIGDYIEVEAREKILNDTLDLFMRHNVIVTDRYHGLIFSIICRKPTIVLRTIDHKLTSALHWFKDISFIRYVSDLEQIEKMIDEVMNVNDFTVPDWNKIYFDKLSEILIGHNEKSEDITILKD